MALTRASARHALVVTSMALMLALPTGAVAAPTDLPVDNTDPAGDVVFTKTPGTLSKADRASIDILKVAARHVDNGVTIDVSIRDVRPKKAKFDQMAFVTMRPGGNSSAEWFAMVGLSAQDPKLAYAYLYEDSNSFVSCDPLTSRALRAKEALRITVPKRCVPKQGARVRVETVTGTFRSDAPTRSRDRAKLVGKVRLR